MEQTLAHMVTPAIEALGFELWGLEYQPGRRHSLLRVFIEGPDGVTVDDCALVSRQVSAVLDVEDPIAGEYTLEISSPGLDRNLYTLDHFRRHTGDQVRVRLQEPFEGRRNFRGLLQGVEGEDVVVVVGEDEFLLPLEWIEKANVVPSF